MNRKNYCIITSVVFAIVAAMHLFRLVYGWPAEIGGVSIPLWASWFALPAAVLIAWSGMRCARS